MFIIILKLFVFSFYKMFILYLQFVCAFCYSLSIIFFTFNPWGADPIYRWDAIVVTTDESRHAISGVQTRKIMQLIMEKY